MSTVGAKSEQQLIEAFRAMDDQAKAALLAAAKAMSSR
jgi:hypothetical protein